VTPSSLSERQWIVFWERDTSCAVTAGYMDEQEITARRVTATDEDQAILCVLGGRATMQDDWRVWAVPADDIKPRPFTVNAVTSYVDVLGKPYVR
jgi:hypothetical protein